MKTVNTAPLFSRNFSIEIEDRDFLDITVYEASYSAEDDNKLSLDLEFIAYEEIDTLKILRDLRASQEKVRITYKVFSSDFDKVSYLVTNSKFILKKYSCHNCFADGSTGMRIYAHFEAIG